MNYFEAITLMHQGHVIQFTGTKNGDIKTMKGQKFCMLRGCIFMFSRSGAIKKTMGSMVYDPDFIYESTGEMIDTTKWEFA